MSTGVLPLIAPILLFYTITITLVNFVLPNYLDLTIGETAGYSPSLQQLNDRTLPNPNIEFLEIIGQLGTAGEQLFIVVILVWLLSDSVRQHWYVDAFQTMQRMDAGADIM